MSTRLPGAQRIAATPLLGYFRSRLFDGPKGEWSADRLSEVEK